MGHASSSKQEAAFGSKVIIHLKSSQPWCSRSIVDGTDVTSTRPGFGIIFKLADDQFVHRIRDAIAPGILVLKTKDSAMHVTVFQSMIYFDKAKYNPASLPNTLLYSLGEELLESFEDVLSEADAAFRQGTVVMKVPEKPWLLLGHGYPSHLAIEVNSEETGEILNEMRNVVDKQHVTKWFAQAVAVIRDRGFKATIERDEQGLQLVGEGWTLRIAFTGNADYKSHITLGMFRTTPRMDDMIRRLAPEFPQRIDSVFCERSPSNWLPEIEVLEDLKWEHAAKCYNETSGVCDRPVDAVCNGQEARTLIPPSFVLKWGSYLLESKLIKTFEQRLRDCGVAMDTSVRLSAVRSDFMDFNRTPNYVPVHPFVM
ncbi:hypothetical protein V5799_010218 [Amblyomma americanum]|uniref:Uncharacterized protein n=1 Tax=Amblyomma americanum TaxID=6943 RepID=A0AAQ4F9Q7_AMBAM